MKTISTRRQFIQSLPAVGAAFSVAGHLVLDGSLARAQEASPLQGHFHPKGKAPSKFTLDVLKSARAGLPFADTRDIEEQKKGLIAPMKDLQIMADAGHVAWDMERFRFLEEKGGIRQHSSLAAPSVRIEQQLRALRGDSGHLPGPRFRPLRHLLRPGQDRLDRF